eukprot:TRINITY_DN21071_c0_g1_i1.p1 TRINITY_DN21071_c0_g1~~TRINITY_DN21071_c0_g1_i1.p1  ORF type:complete len:326 (+),score=98.20 TRINITY_DN21071_c0_g1_i1:42-980(+)
MSAAETEHSVMGPVVGVPLSGEYGLGMLGGLTSPNQGSARANVLMQCMACIRLGNISSMYHMLFTPDAVLKTPTLPSDCSVPYAGTYVGLAGLRMFTARAHEAWGGLKAFDLHSAIVMGDIGYAMLSIELEVGNGVPYKEEEPVTCKFVGDRIAELSLHINTPAALAAYGVKQGKMKAKVNSRCPCPHNSWDNVRAKKGGATLRCRVCQTQWKTSLSELTRCNAFIKGQCVLERNCPNVHVHGKKQSLSERVDRFGAGVLVRVPKHVAAAAAEDQPPLLADDMEFENGSSSESLELLLDRMDFDLLCDALSD